METDKKFRKKGKSMKEFVEKLIERLGRQLEEVIGWNHHEANAYGNAIRIVKRLAEEYEECIQDSTKKNQGWILCSERLPEEDGRYLTTVRYYNGLIKCFDLYLSDEEWLIDEDDEEFSCGKVIAWQPLPEPYKPEEKPEETQLNLYIKRFLEG